MTNPVIKTYHIHSVFTKLTKTVLGCLVMIVVITAGCDSPKTPDPIIPAVLPDSVSYRYKTIEKTFGECDSTFCYQLLVQYPVITDTEFVGLQEYVLSDLIYWKAQKEKGKASLDSLIHEQEIMYNEAVENELSMGQNWYMNLSAYVDYNSNGLLSYTVTKDAFTGGAHPIYESILVSLTLKRADSVHVLTWQDLFMEDKMEALREYVRIHFYEFHDLDYAKPVNDQGFWFESGSFTLNQNFSIQDDGIAVVYNHYEVAPYSTGPTSLFLPWNELYSWLKPEYQFLGQKSK